ncbi:MAG TPA: tetratricopeptide repeat protein, partial [Thermoanaerobaculia bacterium]|nr:tetratricopeptide repeat protein [Thermoanaerobaculia bacterium]
SFALRHSDPAEMIRAAEAARDLLGNIPRSRYGAKVLADLRARVWAELGNAYRVADNLNAAEEALARAIQWARKGTLDLRLQARIGELSASLLSDQRRFPEAVELLDEVRRTYEKVGEDHLADRALIKSGIFTGYDDRPEEAVIRLSRGLCRLEPWADRPLERAAYQSILWHLAEAGWLAAARTILQQRRRFCGRERNRLNELRFYWLEGKIAFGLGDLGKAEASFQVARLGFRRAGKLGDAALVSMDLALLFVQQGRRIETRRLAEEMIATFRSLGIARELLASLALLRKSCADREVSLDVLRGQIQTLATLMAGMPGRAGR